MLFNRSLLGQDSGTCVIGMDTKVIVHHVPIVGNTEKQYRSNKVKSPPLKDENLKISQENLTFQIFKKIVQENLTFQILSFKSGSF